MSNMPVRRRVDVPVGMRKLSRNLLRLVSSGRATAPTRDLASLGPPTVRTKRSVSKALRYIRNDRL
jgi:hypothetical protein